MHKQAKPLLKFDNIQFKIITLSELLLNLTIKKDLINRIYKTSFISFHTLNSIFSHLQNIYEFFKNINIEQESKDKNTSVMRFIVC
jgi:hypothetical protein